MKAYTFGLIGKRLQHSYSPRYFAERFEKENLPHKYLPFEIESVDELPSLIKNTPSLGGLNVTTPYKQAVIPFLQETDEAATAVGAVNTIVVRSDGTLSGYNTDIDGFVRLIRTIYRAIVPPAVILGTGGAAKAIGYVLTKYYRQRDYYYVSRNPKNPDEIGYNDLTESLLKHRRLIVNATPVGMYPNVDECPPVPFEFLTPKHGVIDLIYNPEETVFLRKAKEIGCKTANGLEMLYAQADLAWETWQFAHGL